VGFGLLGFSRKIPAAKENRGNEPLTAKDAKEFAKFAKEFFAAFALTLRSLRLQALVYPLKSI